MDFESLRHLPQTSPAATVLAVVGGLIVVLGPLGLLGRVPLRYNVRNLFVRWRTTLMTALAFTMVTGLLVVMLAFVNGMVRLTLDSGQPGNVMVLSDGSTDETFSDLGFSNVSEIEFQPGILRDGDVPLSSRETYLVVNQPLAHPQPGKPARRFLQIRGLDDPVLAGRVHGLKLQAGGAWFGPSGVEKLKGESLGSRQSPVAVQCVLGGGIAREMARDRSPEAQQSDPREQLLPGDRFELGDLTWVVTGVRELSGSTFDSEVWAKRSIAGPLFGKETYSTLVLRTAGPEEARRLKEYLNKDYKQAAVNSHVETEYFAAMNDTNKQFLYAIIFVTVVMSVGGVFGVMNTMFAAIAQRSRDLGVLRLIGFKRWQILTSLMMESLGIAVIGGAVGCALGSFCDGWQATSVVSSGQGGAGKFIVLTLVVDANIIAAGMLVAIVMGFIGGLIPALSALRLRPLEALR